MPSPLVPGADTQAILERLKLEAAEQAGIVHRNQILRHDISGERILSWSAHGWIEPRFRHTYALPGTQQSLATRCWSALLSAGGDTAITSSQALSLMDIISERRGPVECVRSIGRARRQPGLVVHNTDYLPAEDLTTVHGLRSTAFPRAALDYAATAAPDEIDRALDRGVRLQLFDGRAFERLTTEYARAPGRAALAAALGRLDETAGLKRSELERRLIKLIMGSSMPTPIVNGMLGGFEVDVHWHGTRAIVEADGHATHTSPAAVARDLAKRKVLESLGFVLMLVDWNAVVYQPEVTLARIDRFRLANLAAPVPRLLQAG